jgi:hypothetical protein
MAVCFNDYAKFEACYLSARLARAHHHCTCRLLQTFEIPIIEIPDRNNGDILRPRSAKNRACFLADFAVTAKEP